MRVNMYSFSVEVERTEPKLDMILGQSTSIDSTMTRDLQKEAVSMLKEPLKDAGFKLEGIKLTGVHQVCSACGAYPRDKTFAFCPYCGEKF